MMKSRKKSALTQQLENLINGFFTVDEVMILVSQGANPNIKDQYGRPLIYKIVDLMEINPSSSDEYIAAVYDLLVYYGIKYHHAKQAVRLISNSQINQAILSFIEKLEDNIENKIENSVDLQDFAIAIPLDPFGKILEENKNFIEKVIPSRSNFLTLLIYLTNDIHNKASTSFFKFMPIDIILYIISFLEFDEMQKTWQQGVSLAAFMLAEHAKIKSMAAHPGGINVFQETKKNNIDIKFNSDSPMDSQIYHFALFKSAKTLSQDYNKLKSDFKLSHQQKHPHLSKLPGSKISDSSAKILSEFKDKYALPYFDEHSSLFSSLRNKDKLYKSLSDTDLYKNLNLKKQ